MSAVILGVSGSVSVYKACDLASQLTQAGHSVHTVMTQRAAELVRLVVARVLDLVRALDALAPGRAVVRPSTGKGKRRKR